VLTRERATPYNTRRPPHLADPPGYVHIKGFDAAKTEDHGLNIADLDTTGAAIIPVNRTSRMGIIESE